MPIPVPLIGAGIGLLGEAVGAISQGSANRKQRQFAVQMYNRQRADALADWDMANQYNSPEEQMARLKAAGLNPNLVYDKGNSIISAQPVRSSSPGSYNPQPFKPNAGSIMAGYVDTAFKQAQTDNVKKQTEVATEQAKLIQAQTLGTLVGTAGSQFDLGLKSDLRDTTIEMAKSVLEKSKADTKYTTNQDLRAAIANTQSVQESVQRILNMKQDRLKSAAETLKTQAETANTRVMKNKIEAEIKQLKALTENTQLEKAIKELDARMARQGIRPGDPWYQRGVLQLLNRFGVDLGLPGEDEPEGPTDYEDLFQ